MEHRLNELSRNDIVTLGDILCGYTQHPEIKSFGPNGEKCTADIRGLLLRMAVNGESFPRLREITFELTQGSVPG